MGSGEMKEKIADYLCRQDIPLFYAEIYAKGILALFPSLAGIVVEEKCEDCVYQNSEGSIDCPMCNNTGTVTGPATKVGEK